MPRLAEDPVKVPEPDKYKISQYLGRESDPKRTNISVALEIVQKGVSKPQHYHKASDEVFYVLAGRGRLTVDGVPQELAQGDMFLVEVGQRHFLTASADEALSVLLISTPAYEPSDYILC